LEFVKGIPGLKLVLAAEVNLGGDTRMGKIMDTAIIPAMRCRPTTYDPLDCRR
jgi:hypothetical protein